MQSSKPITIIGFGGPGVGKSNLMNFTIHGYASNHFKSSSSCQTGVTQKIQVGEGTALGMPHQRRVKVVDLPGLGDPKIDLDNIQN
jgi:GTP-binding protein EngB required for normal cell division